MNDEIPATPPKSDAPETSEASTQPTPSAEVEVEKNISPAVAAPAPPASGTNKHEDVHDVPHPHFKWHAEAMVDGHEIYSGIVRDISVKGANLFLDHNLQNSKSVKLHIHIPPLVVKDPPHVLEVSGKIKATVYDSVEDAFRSAISFTGFTLESDQDYLRSRIADH